MKSEDSTYNMTVQLLGVSSITEIGLVAAKELSRIKNKPGKNMITKCYAVINLFDSALTHKYNLMSY